MKKITKLFILAAVISLSALTKANAQEIGVSIRLNRPARYEHNERFHPNRPSPGHVWVAEEWTWQNGGYVYRPGYWALPPRPRAVWVAGHWGRHHRHYIWIGGHWS